MDNESLIAIRLLETIALCNSKLEQLSIELRNRPDVLSRETVLECKAYPVSGISLSFNLDAELKSGNCLNFYLGLSWSNRDWVISSNISVNDEHGYKVIKDFSEKHSSNYEELLILLESAVSELLSNSSVSDN